MISSTTAAVKPCVSLERGLGVVEVLRGELLLCTGHRFTSKADLEELGLANFLD